MSSNSKIELIQLLDEKAKRLDKTLYLKHWKMLYDWQRKFIAKTSTNISCLLMAANRCVPGYTLIKGKFQWGTDLHSHRFLDILSLKDFDVSTMVDGYEQTSSNYRAYFQGISPVVRLYLEDGASLDCTYEHQLLTCEGNYSTISRLMSQTDVHHSLKIHGGLTDSYDEGDCLYGQLPQLLTDIYQEHILTLADALEQNQKLLPEDVAERIDRYTQALSNGDLLTNPDARHHAEGLSDLFPDLSDHKRAERMSCLLQELTLCYPEFLQSLPVELTHSDKIFDCDEVYSNHIYFPSKPPIINNDKKIIAWQLMGMQPVYDLQVLDSHNYITNGIVSHNCGKTFTGCLVDSIHATGKYPDDWEGHKFEHAPLIWVLGYSGEKIRDLLQAPMVGNYSGGSLEGGLIPSELILDALPAMGTPRCVREVRVRHISGGTSRVQFWSYSQGQHALMGDSVDWYHIDEEPKDSKIYPQVVTRTATGDGGRGGRGILTFTPENGRTELVISFMDHPGKSQYMQRATWDDAYHLNEETKEAILAIYPPYQRDMRTKGLPLLGSGLIFDLPIECNKVKPFECPDHWYMINGMDFGWDHPQAHIQLWWNKDTDVMYVAQAWKRRKVQPYEVWQEVKGWAEDVPTAWPHDGLQTEKGSAKAQKSYYEEAGWAMLPAHATWPSGDLGVEQGIMEIYNNIKLKKLMFIGECGELTEEFLQYHRDDNGKIVKIQDDLLSALRYAYMMRRYAIRKYDIINAFEDEEYEQPKEYW